MRRGWARYTPRFPLTKQREAIIAAGVKPDAIYEPDKKGDVTIAAFIRALRKGDVVVVDGLHRLAETWSGMLDALEQIAARGCRVMDARTGHEADAGAAFLIADARRVYSGEARIPDHKTAVERGKKGGRRRQALGNEHKRMWKDIVTYKRNEDAAVAISKALGRPVSVPTLRRHFGASGRMAGWYPKSEQD